MRLRSHLAATDTISSIALVSCCVVSSLVLIATLSYSFGERTILQIHILTEEGNLIFHKLIEQFTDTGDDGIRYLRNDWKSVTIDIRPWLNKSSIIFCIAYIRTFHQPELIIADFGNPSECKFTECFNAPALLLTGYSAIPAELSMVVGI